MSAEEFFRTGASIDWKGIAMATARQDGHRWIEDLNCPIAEALWESFRESVNNGGFLSNWLLALDDEQFDYVRKSAENAVLYNGRCTAQAIALVSYWYFMGPGSDKRGSEFSTPESGKTLVYSIARLFVATFFEYLSRQGVLHYLMRDLAEESPSMTVGDKDDAIAAVKAMEPATSLDQCDKEMWDKLLHLYSQAKASMCRKIEEVCSTPVERHPDRFIKRLTTQLGDGSIAQVGIACLADELGVEGRGPNIQFTGKQLEDAAEMASIRRMEESVLGLLQEGVRLYANPEKEQGRNNLMELVSMLREHIELALVNLEDGDRRGAIDSLRLLVGGDRDGG